MTDITNLELASDELSEGISEEQRKLDEKGKVWGPEDAAKFGRKKRSIVRAWMDAIHYGRR